MNLSVIFFSIRFAPCLVLQTASMTTSISDICDGRRSRNDVRFSFRPGLPAFFYRPLLRLTPIHAGHLLRSPILLISLFWSWITTPYVNVVQTAFQFSYNLFP